MIFKSVIDAVYNLFAYFIGLFPDANEQVVDIMVNGIYDVKTYMVDFNWILPIDTLFFAVNVMIVAIYAVIFIKTVRWILSIITVNLIH